MEYVPRMAAGAMIAADCDLCAFTGQCRPAEPFAIAWLRQMGEALSNATPMVTARPDGQGGRLALDFPSFGDCTTAAMHLHTLKAMMKVDRGL